MAKRELDDHSGVETTGHEWDGIRELDHPLPRWWLYLFYACIVWAVGYWIVYPAWPTWNSYTKGILNNSDRARVASEVKDLQKAREPKFVQLAATPLDQVKNNKDLYNFALEAGRSTFNDNCATCHGANGQGVKGFPSLQDNVWLWDGTYAGIKQTLQYGIRSGHEQARLSQMPSFGADALLDANQIDGLTNYVMNLSGIKGVDAAKAQGAAQLFQEQCSSCHGVTGAGDPKQGAPNLTDKEYLYGKTKADINAQIHSGKGGVMPAWGAKFDDRTLSALTVYVHSLGGGQ